MTFFLMSIHCDDIRIRLDQVYFFLFSLHIDRNQNTNTQPK